MLHRTFFRKKNIHSTTIYHPQSVRVACRSFLQLFRMSDDGVPCPDTSAISENMTDQKHRKKRASKACLTCRKRKVKCTVSLHEGPCYNCRMNGINCVVRPRKKRYEHFLVRNQPSPVVYLKLQEIWRQLPLVEILFGIQKLTLNLY